jgi:hypothetical protein
MIRDRTGEVTIGCGYEHELATGCLFLPEKIQNLLPIRKARGVKRNAAGKLALQEGWSAKQPERQKEQAAGPVFQKSDDALPQKITADQGAVEVDTEYRRSLFGGLCSGGRSHKEIVANGPMKRANKWDT